MQLDATVRAVAQALKSKPSIFPQQPVRHLFLHERTGRETSEELLMTISSLDSLVLREYSATDTDLLRSLENTRIKRLAFFWTWDRGYYVDSTHAMFSSVTHLIIHREYDNPHGDVWEKWAPLAALLTLTHLCVSDFIASGILADVLSHCSRLRTLVTMWRQTWYDTTGACEKFSKDLPVADVRVVLMTHVDYWTEWNIHAQGGDDFWVRADEFIARKRRGEIDGMAPFLRRTK